MTQKGEQRGNGPKLSAEIQQYVCACLATGFCPEIVADKLKEEYDIEVTPKNIRKNYLHGKKWKKVIEGFRKRFEKDILKEPLAIKANRLRWLNEGINEAMRFRHDKTYYFEGQELSKVEKRNVGIVAALIREARAEVEGERGPEVVVPITVYLPKKDGE